MSNHCFSFLEEEFPDIASECESCEKHYVEGNYTESVLGQEKLLNLFLYLLLKIMDFKNFIIKKLD